MLVPSRMAYHKYRMEWNRKEHDGTGRTERKGRANRRCAKIRGGVSKKAIFSKETEKVCHARSHLASLTTLFFSALKTSILYYEHFFLQRN